MKTHAPRFVAAPPLPLALLLTLLASAASAQTTVSSPGADPKKPEEVVVLEEYTVTTGSRVALAIDRIPGSVQLLTTQKVQDTLSYTEDATAVLAKLLPGYSESTQALSSAGETLRGRRPLRLFDGIPMSTPLRETDRTAIFTDMDVIDRIEVVNGASATEGIGGAGGVINYVTKTATEEGTHGVVTGRVFSNGLHKDGTGTKAGITVTHKRGRFDLLFAASHTDRGLPYDGHGTPIGLNQSGSIGDSQTDNFFFKLGYNFGSTASPQRVDVKWSSFRLEGKGNYTEVDGDRATGRVDTVVKGRPLGGQSPFNDIETISVSYHNYQLPVVGGEFVAHLYRGEEHARFVAEDGTDRQDPAIAPLGTLIDQSEVAAVKYGALLNYHRGDLFSVSGLDLNFGADIIQDTTQQKLALTNRVWVPPMELTGLAPFVQGSYSQGPVTVTAGVRRENSDLQVNDYTTTWFRNAVFVEGGTLHYKDTLSNFGGILRLPAGFSVTGSYTEGFELPNVGIPLRNQNKPGQKVDGILDLAPIITKSREAGLSWRGQVWNGRRATFSASAYRATSVFGASLIVDPVTRDFIIRRAPVTTKGIEAQTEIALTEVLTLNGRYSRIIGRTTTVAGGPKDREQGIGNISPDKLGFDLAWKFSDRGRVRLGATTLLGRDLNVGRANEEHTSGYTLWDLSASYRWKLGETILGVENLTDKFYLLSSSQVEGFRNFTAGRGRVISLTQRYSF